ncbi:hypothetical protein P9112_011564 [Eukaryota sp. TZLM1-RC]
MNSNTQQPRPSIRIGSPEARRRILEEETGPSSSPLTADQAPVPPLSVEAFALPEDSPLEGYAPKEDSSPPEDSGSIEGSSPPQDSVPVEGRSSSLVSYDDEDVEETVAPLPFSQLRVSEVPPSSLPERSSEVPLSPSTQSRETVLPSLAIKEESGVQPVPLLQRPLKYHLHPSVPILRSHPLSLNSSSLQFQLLGSPLTTTTVSRVNNLTVSPAQARETTPSTPNFPSNLSEKQRKRYELIFLDMVDYEEPSREFSPITQPPVPSKAPISEIDRVTGEVSKQFLERYFQEERNWELRKRLDREIKARRGASSTPAHHQPL